MFWLLLIPLLCVLWHPATWPLACPGRGFRGGMPQRTQGFLCCTGIYRSKCDRLNLRCVCLQSKCSFCFAKYRFCRPHVGPRRSLHRPVPSRHLAPFFIHSTGFHQVFRAWWLRTGFQIRSGLVGVHIAMVCRDLLLLFLMSAPVVS